MARFDFLSMHSWLEGWQNRSTFVASLIFPVSFFFSSCRISRFFFGPLSSSPPSHFIKIGLELFSHFFLIWGLMCMLCDVDVHFSGSYHCSQLHCPKSDFNTFKSKIQWSDIWIEFEHQYLILFCVRHFYM